MPFRIAFAGFRHAHIFALHDHLRNHPEAVIVGACESNPAARDAAAARGVAITHAHLEAMLEEVECDAVACGAVYADRGTMLLRALESGRHVISDKPLCTSLEELARIHVASAERGLHVGCMFDLGDAAPFQTLLRLLDDDAIGEVHAVTFEGQHPLLYGSRPAWYFDEGLHGGTLNDIAVHAIDLIPRLTGFRIVDIIAARVWNARHREHPYFQDGAMLMLRLDNDAGVMGDVSYLAPDSHAYAQPNYWRFALTGSDGLIETAYTAEAVHLLRNGAPLEHIPLDPPRPGGYFEDFLAEIQGAPDPCGLTTTRVLQSSRIALLAQAAAEAGTYPCPVG